MLDENRIRLMARMASYEETEGKKTIPIAGYFRGDYVTFNVVMTAISVTIAFALLTAAYIYYNMETFIADIYKLDIEGMARRILSIYLIVLGVFSVFAYFFYSWKYDRAKKSLHGYHQALRKLSDSYDEE
ncbi:MAG: hypothetical protein IKR68_09655 [Lachnospiraceae bacterium]|nr:hypothetical protein [Lachnospiraceae bacterium]